MAKITIDQIKEELAQDRWELVSQEYKNLDAELVAKCPEGHTVYSTWGKLRTKRECTICKNNKYKINKTAIKEKKTGITRVLGLDQATHISGYALMDGAELVHYGTFTVSAEDETARIHQVKEWLMSIINNYHPDVIGIEGTQYQENMGVTTFQVLCRLQGVILDLCYELDIPCKIQPTNTWRAHCGVKGRSRADKKRSMQGLVKLWFDVSVSDDESDAIGITKYTAETYQKQTTIIEWE